MNLFKTIFALFLMCMLVILNGCGNAGGDGKGNTVYIEPHITTGQPMALTVEPIGVSPYTAAQALSRTGFTFKSTSYPHANGIPASTVIITSANISYTPQLASTLVLSPPLTTWNYPVFAASVPPDTDASKIENMNLLDTIRMIELDNAAAAGVTYNYIVNVQFVGKELNSDLSITCKTVSGLLTVRR